MAEELERFRVTNDSEAEWVISKIKEEEEEAARLQELIDAKRAELDLQEQAIQNSLESKTRFFKGLLAEYMDTVKGRETKTQKSYQLLSGKLVQKKPSYRYDRDEKALLEWAKATGKQEYVEEIERLKWAELKTRLLFDEDKVIDIDTGEEVTGITATLEPGKFEVKI